MINVGSIDGGKVLSSRYGIGGGKMDLETELEEGEACFQNNNGDDSTIDPDIALSYIDEKLQDVLGHFQKDFEGGVSAENLGAKFGGYGSFLPTYQRSPVCPHPKTPPKVFTYNAPISPNNLHIEGGQQNSVSQSNASQAVRRGPASGLAPRGSAINGKVKQEVPKSSAKNGEKSTSNGQKYVDNFANTSDQKSLKVRLRLGSDNLTQRNAEIYSGLGLDVSPSSSMEATPVNSDGVFHAPHDSPDESPTSILELMTSFPVHGSRLLSPLPYDLLNLTEKAKFGDSNVQKGSQESAVTVVNGPDFGRVDRNVPEEKKSRSTENNSVSMESASGNDFHNGVGAVTRKETDTESLACEELVSNALTLPLLSNSLVDFGKTADLTRGSKDEYCHIAKEERVDPPLTRDGQRVEKPNYANSDEKVSILTTKVNSDVSKGSKNLDNGVVKAPKQKGGQKASSREKDSAKLTRGKPSSSGGKKKSQGSQVAENGSQNVEVSKGGVKNDSSSTSKNNSHGSKSYTEDLKISNGKVREAYKDFFGELDLEQEDDDDLMAMEEKPCGEMLKDSVNIVKDTKESNSLSKEKLNANKSQKPSSSRVDSHIVPTIGHGPVSDAVAAATVPPPVVNEDWVCCDKCEKWRLLPPGVNPGSLPEKWLCSMLDWLPGMNRCSISEEETTKAITSQFPGPAPIVQASHHIHGGPQLGLIASDALHFDQKDQHFGSQALSLGVKKKQERPSLSSNSTKKKSRSLSGVNPSPAINDVEFQDSGQSSRLAAEKHGLKHKETKNEGDAAHQSKIRNKRESFEDYSRESKKVKRDSNHGTNDDQASDHGGVVFKANRSSNSGLSEGVSKKDRRKHGEKDSKPVSNCDERDVAKKRKSNEFDNTQTLMEESSETDYRKEKKARILKSGEDEKGRSVKDEQFKSSNVMDFSKREVVPVQASMAATSSSSKVSGSHKTKGNNNQGKGSPVESVSSSPLRTTNLEKFTSLSKNIGAIDEPQVAQGPKKCSNGDDDKGNVARDDAHKVLEIGNYHVTKAETSQGLSEEKMNNRPKKHAKGSSLRSKDKNRSFKSDIDKVNLNTSEPMNENKNRYQEKPYVNSINLEKRPVLKKEPSGKPSNVIATSSHDMKKNLPLKSNGEKASKRDTSERGKSNSLPPSGKSQNETVRISQTTPGSQNKKTEPNRHKGRDHEAPSPLRRDSSAATNAIKEAKDLKHLADRLKNTGSNLESTSLYFQAALKFLHGASLLEAGNSESGKVGDIVQSMAIYSSTAKLCEFCAHEYEKSKEMAPAALAYKCTEVAYLKVVYSSHPNACKDRHELQTSLQIGATSDSPSSSASDLDNLNNPSAIDKAAIAKSVNSPQVAANHVISARNKPNLMRILNYAQDVIFAMEASRRSQIAFAASSSKLEESHHKEGISAVKKALDFNFQDVEKLLRLVRLAMEAISR